MDSPPFFLLPNMCSTVSKVSTRALWQFAVSQSAIQVQEYRNCRRRSRRRREKKLRSCPTFLAFLFTPKKFGFASKNDIIHIALLCNVVQLIFVSQHQTRVSQSLEPTRRLDGRWQSKTMVAVQQEMNI